MKLKPGVTSTRWDEVKLVVRGENEKIVREPYIKSLFSASPTSIPSGNFEVHHPFLLDRVLIPRCLDLNLLEGTFDFDNEIEVLTISEWDANGISVSGEPSYSRT